MQLNKMKKKIKREIRIVFFLKKVVGEGHVKNVSREKFDSALTVHYLNELLSSALTQALFGLK